MKGVPEDREDMSVSEAAASFEISESRLRLLLSVGEIAGYKVKGARVREWRVSSAALERAGYERRAPIDDTTTPGNDLRRQVRRLATALAAERARSADLDQRLGHALLSAGRLRAQLRSAGLEPEEFGAPAAPSGLEGGEVPDQRPATPLEAVDDTPHAATADQRRSAGFPPPRR